MEIQAQKLGKLTIKRLCSQRLLKDQGIVFTKLSILFAEFGAHTHIHSVKIVERLKSDKSYSGRDLEDCLDNC